MRGDRGLVSIGFVFAATLAAAALACWPTVADAVASWRTCPRLSPDQLELGVSCARLTDPGYVAQLRDLRNELPAAP